MVRVQGCPLHTRPFYPPHPPPHWVSRAKSRAKLRQETLVQSSRASVTPLWALHGLVQSSRASIIRLWPLHARPLHAPPPPQPHTHRPPRAKEPVVQSARARTPGGKPLCKTPVQRRPPCTPTPSLTSCRASPPPCTKIPRAKPPLGAKPSDAPGPRAKPSCKRSPSVRTAAFCTLTASSPAATRPQLRPLVQKRDPVVQKPVVQKPVVQKPVVQKPSCKNSPGVVRRSWYLGTWGSTLCSITHMVREKSPARKP